MHRVTDPTVKWYELHSAFSKPNETAKKLEAVAGLSSKPDSITLRAPKAAMHGGLIFLSIRFCPSFLLFFEPKAMILLVGEL